MSDLQQIENKPTTRFFVKATLRVAFTKNLGLVCSECAVGTPPIQEYLNIYSCRHLLGQAKTQGD